MSSQQAFDYIIVGSGAGGAPLAARLAEAGFRVLVLEAGADHLATDGPAVEATLVPGFHALSTEHDDLAWRFFVQHYDSPPTGPDPKADARGIFYPRAAALGGCTVHNAMITIAGPDSDWDDLADFVADDSWRGTAMRAYFERLEHNDYSAKPTPSPTGWWARRWDDLKWLLGFEPDHSSGRHGFGGWLHTSVTKLSLGLADTQLVGVLKGALRQSRRKGLDRGWALVKRFVRGEVFRDLDPNHSQTQARSPEGLALIPLAVCGGDTTIHQNSETPFAMRGRRSSPREFLLNVRARHPDRLVIRTEVLVTRILFDTSGGEKRAIGVELVAGPQLYAADANYDPNQPSPAAEYVYVDIGGEVIVCGGSFNTPQLLMLSGIGDEQQLVEVAGNAAHGCALHGRNGVPLTGANGESIRVHLPGVGRNLQDRYEVTVISEMKRDFSLLDDAKFKLEDGANPADRHLKEWRAEGTGIYTSNGAVLGIFKRSKPDLEQPDLFIFGLPLPFPGYQIGYSKVGHIHDHFTWAILKGHTRNTDGTVKLQSLDPRQMPLINFHYFNEVSCEGKGNDDPDLLALVDGVKFVRGIANHTGLLGFGLSIKDEVHPGRKEVPPDNDQAIKDWIRRVAWGHHATGTCRMGPDGDTHAVLDSRFRVRGVQGLRVVDASIFPRIPGYFIVTNIYMASEKAADTIIEDARFARTRIAAYPHELHKLERAAIALRRGAVDPADRALPELKSPPKAGSWPWPEDVAGLALSGGGIRSATFNLGVLQALARHKWLRRFDILSTVSGGGYIGTFLGRWFDRLRPASEWGRSDDQPLKSAADRIERELNDPDSPAIDWLRKHGNYIAPGGGGEIRYNIALFVRNLLSVYLVVGALLFALFGLANLIRYWALDPAGAVFGFIGMDLGDLPLGRLLEAVFGVFFSPWFVLFELIVLIVAVPRAIAYWIVSPDRRQRYDGVPLFATLVISGALLFVSVSGRFNLPVFLLGISPLLSLIHVELAWRRSRRREEATGRGSVDTQRPRNYLTYDLGLALALAGGALAFALIDTVGHGLQQAAAANEVYLKAFAAFGAGVAALGPVLRYLASLYSGERSAEPNALVQMLKKELMAGLLALVMLVVPLVFMSFAAHAAFQGGLAVREGLFATAFALFLTFVFAHSNAITFVNRSSLAQTYAARLSRAYLGASNPVRYRPQAQDVTEVGAGDDVSSIRDYKPYLTGGPLHLINMTVNQTVDFSSQRGNRDRKGENVMVDSIGMTVGEEWHSAWSDPHSGEPIDGGRKRSARLVPVGHVPGTEHPLVDEVGDPATDAEMLPLRQWMAISGAAFGPAMGQTTKLGTALLFGLANLRTGYWWNSGISESARDGFPPLTFMRRIFYVLHTVFRTQGLLLAEWIARFPGPWDQYWQLSDGGHFEVLGGYELIRRRVPRIVICDASADPSYKFESFANLVRKARIDFDAEIEPADLQTEPIPANVLPYLGTLDELKPGIDEEGRVTMPAKRAALFRVRYEKYPDYSPILLYVKATIGGDESADVAQYRKAHTAFPHEPTEDQFFDEEQWESYRMLGEHTFEKLCGAESSTWFWKIPV